MTKTTIIKALGIALAFSTLSGCGQSSLLAATGLSGLALQDGTTATADGQRAGKGSKGGPGRGGDMGGKGHDMGGKGGPMGLFAGLTLTAEQATQLKAIAEKYKPTAPAGDQATRPVNAVAELLKAETLDVEALKAALAAQATPPAKADRTAQLVETRAVLTAEQIATLVAKLKAQPAPAERPTPPAGAERPDAATRAAEVATKLGLTEEQKALYTAFEAKMAANRPAAPEADHHAAERAAMVTFWETGDTAALEAAKPVAADRPAFPVDEFVALAVSLNAEQRAQILGKGGHGGHGGRGGDKGGFGHGGPRGEAPPVEAAV